MYTYPYLCDYICYLEAQLQKERSRNKKLKKKASKTLHIEKMEYNIELLKVDTLSGTMNLGVTAETDEETMKDLVNQLTKTGNFNVTIGDNDESVDPPEPSVLPVDADEESTTTL